jgi:hypothetical protein
MSDSANVSRRRLIAGAVGSPLAAQRASHETKHGPTAPAKHRQYLSDHEFQTLRTLCDLIIPADEFSPAASAAGAPEYIDLLCGGNRKLAHIYHGGLAWLDSTCLSLHGVPFREAAPEQQNQIVEKLAYREKAPADWAVGTQFFDWARRMTLDGFYTSPAGYRDVGYRGGHGMTTFQVPEEAIRQALKKANL